jgi:YggT family protein
VINLFILRFATAIIRCLELMFFVRAIMSWFPQSRDSKISEFLYVVTEPIILPFRNLLNRFDALRGFPLDISFLLAFFSLELILTLLYSL